LPAARTPNRADSVQRRTALPRPVPAHLPRRFRGSLRRRVDADRCRLTAAESCSELTWLRREAHTVFGMERARRHQRLLARLALGLLALVAELGGRSLTHRLDLGRHVDAPSYSGAEYYPILLAVVKVGLALMLARLTWRFVKARAVARAARRLHAAHGSRPGQRAPRVHFELSPGLWLLT